MIKDAINRIFPADNEEVLIRKIVNHLDRDMAILDVGCGFGEKIMLFKSMGFENILGVEKNERIVKRARDEGLHVLSVDEFWDSARETYDLIIMSHIIEHFGWAELIDFIDSYLDLLKDGGLFFVITPIFHKTFYFDFDHVKPYLPHSINQLYVMKDSQIQVDTNHRLQLIDIYFRKSKYELLFYRSLFIHQNSSIPRNVNRVLRILFRLSHYKLGRKTGWVGLYKKIE